MKARMVGNDVVRPYKLTYRITRRWRNVWCGRNIIRCSIISHHPGASDVVVHDWIRLPTDEGHSKIPVVLTLSYLVDIKRKLVRNSLPSLCHVAHLNMQRMRLILISLWKSALERLHARFHPTPPIDTSADLFCEEWDICGDGVKLGDNILECQIGAGVCDGKCIYVN